MGQKIDVDNLSTEDLVEAVKSCMVTDDAFDSAGQQPGLEIWRIEKFKVVTWPKEEYGSFYSGDSYIVLNTWKSEGQDKLNYDVHFWLGADTSQDEAGTAAYKSVELDERFSGAAVQHREVEGAESKRFLQYFKTFTVQKGGMESGFNKVTPEEYRPRLLHVCGTFKAISVREVPLEAGSLNSSDVFILDKGTTIFQFCGKSCSPFERQRANAISENMEASRAGKAKTEVVEEDDAPEEFWDTLGGKTSIAKEGNATKDVRLQTETRSMSRISDESGVIKFDKLDAFDQSTLDTKDVFVVDAGWEVFVWIGKDASKQERAKAMSVAEKYLKQNGRPSTLPISTVREGHEPALFTEVLTQ